jgi:ABC-2 type transport system permease protein
MRLNSTLRAFPTMLKVGFSEAVAYRAEMLVWVFSTTMPFVMMVLWSSVAEVAPLSGQSGQRWGSDSFVTYFLCVFVARQMISAWASWEINFEVRHGGLALRLLRPIHPIVSYALSNLAHLPLRAAVTIPVVTVLVVKHSERLAHDYRLWLLLPFALLGAWMVTFFVNVTIGSLSFFFGSSIKVMDVWLASFFVFSGYNVPLDIFPAWLGRIIQWLPFRFQLALPVELMTGAVDFSQALLLVGKQYCWVAILLTLSTTLWTFGVRRFQAFGG